jgi:hypothetical protein
VPGWSIWTVGPCGPPELLEPVPVLDPDPVDVAPVAVVVADPVVLMVPDVAVAVVEPVVAPPPLPVPVEVVEPVLEHPATTNANAMTD